jgi:hypothetical protein
MTRLWASPMESAELGTWYEVAAAAPTHVRAARQLVLDPLAAADQRALARIATKLRTRPVDLS